MIPNLITGGKHTDQRGTLSFVNDFDMSQVERFYIIEHPTTEIVRGWRAHRIEQRWFYVVDGSILVRLVKIDDWENPSKNLPVIEFRLSAKETQVLHIPAGYGSSIQAFEPNSKLIVFADYGIGNAKFDDYLFPIDYFKD